MGNKTPESSVDITSFVSGTAIVFVGTVLSNLSGFIERVFLGNSLSVESFGNVGIALSIWAIGLSASQLGVPLGVARYIPRYQEEEQKRGVYQTGIILTFLGSSIISLSVIIGSPVAKLWIPEFGKSIYVLQLLAVALIPISLMNTSVQAMRGMENSIYRVAVNDILYPLTRIGLIVLLILIGLENTSVGYAYIFAGCAAAFVSVYLLSNLIGLRGPSTLVPKELIGYSIPLMLSSIVLILITKVDTIMVGGILGAQQAGLYSAAYPVANGLIIALSASGYLYLPLVSRLDANDTKETERIEQIYALTAKWILIFTFPPFAVFVFFPSDIIGIFFGSGYSQASTPLVILSIGFFLNAVLGRCQETLSALDFTRFVFIANLSAFILNIILNLLLIPTLGIVGASAASSAAFISMNLLAIATLYYVSGIVPINRYNIKTGIILFALLFPCVWISTSLINLTYISLLPYLIVLGLTSIILVGVGGGFQNEDMEVINLLEEKIGIQLWMLRIFINGDNNES